MNKMRKKVIIKILEFVEIIAIKSAGMASVGFTYQPPKPKVLIKS